MRKIPHYMRKYMKNKICVEGLSVILTFLPVVLGIRTCCEFWVSLSTLNHLSKCPFPTSTSKCLFKNEKQGGGGGLSSTLFAGLISVSLSSKR